MQREEKGEPVALVHLFFYVFPSESETESAVAVASEGRLPKRSEAEPPSRVSEMQTKYN